MHLICRFQTYDPI